MTSSHISGPPAAELCRLLDAELSVRSRIGHVALLLASAAMTVVVASLIAVPLATIISRFDFRGAALIHTLGVVPLVMPPFVGAVAMQLIYGRNGSINLLLNEWFGFRIPFMEGLNGVIFVEALH